MFKYRSLLLTMSTSLISQWTHIQLADFSRITCYDRKLISCITSSLNMTKSSLYANTLYTVIRSQSIRTTLEYRATGYLHDGDKSLRNVSSSLWSMSQRVKVVLKAKGNQPGTNKSSKSASFAHFIQGFSRKSKK